MRSLSVTILRLRLICYLAYVNNYEIINAFSDVYEALDEK